MAEDMQDIHNLGDGRSRHAIRRSRFSHLAGGTRDVLLEDVGS